MTIMQEFFAVGLCKRFQIFLPRYLFTETKCVVYPLKNFNKNKYDRYKKRKKLYFNCFNHLFINLMRWMNLVLLHK